MIEMRCTNFGECSKADSRETIPVADAQNTTCPGCHKNTLRPAGGPPPIKKPPIVPIVAGLVVLLLVFFAFKAFSGGKPTPPVDPNKPVKPGQTGTPVNPVKPVTPGGDNPLPPGVVDVPMFYEGSVEKWLGPTADEFNKQNAGQYHITWEKGKKGSREGKDEILYGKTFPILWNPADTYWLDKLRRDWRDPKFHKPPINIVGNHEQLVSTRLVLIMPQDRAERFRAAMTMSQYRGKTWKLLSDIATRGWDVTGAFYGEKLKFAMTNPITSNSGRMALVLMLAEYRREFPGATPGSPGFRRFMTSVLDTVDEFPETTSKVIDPFLAGEANIALMYEANALAKLKDVTAGQIAIVYTDPPAAADFPIAMLNGDWVTAPQAQAAQKFINFVRDPEFQKGLLDVGLRPALSSLNAATQEKFSDSTWVSAGAKYDVQPQPHGISGKEIADLLFQAKSIYKDKMPGPDGK